MAGNVQLIITGFHRSGTSLLTQILHAGGLFVGEDLLGSLPTNVYGHFEDLEVLQIHRAILRRNGTYWQSDQPRGFFIGPDNWQAMRRLVKRRDAEHSLWGFKDPRACLFMGAWKYLLPDAKFVMVYRDPGECVRSMESRSARDLFDGEGPPALHRRFFAEPDHGLKLWDTYNRAALAFAGRNAEHCAVVPFTQLSEGFPLIDYVNRRFDAGLGAVATSSVFDSTATRRPTVPLRYHDPEVAQRVTETWGALERLAQETESTWSR